MNKKTIITILLVLVAVAGTSDAFNFRINYKDDHGVGSTDHFLR